jgi:hypothetical protein
MTSKQIPEPLSPTSKLSYQVARLRKTPDGRRRLLLYLEPLRLEGLVLSPNCRTTFVE